ncbi:acyl-CoA N-acyltransferase [Aspergillus sclerotioniger CBS 115572]|uniref:Acyl-CoA N-acyltransferase n=1 Tax=Aspergillus sclerotioniger CBS 115572 TaxID=1450535 RepID=A0A317XED2_9EURO|nr:acyl-CoA N-acyltransferase [Aspergillus sclerotioniger CBS 115572]PWY95298.1 acyl-CoA N-acyltransferase [Aspergillus sclerotioniger CBS 115572]
MIHPTTFTTPRLTLSPLTPEDVHDLHDIRSRDEVMKWSLKGTPDPTPQTTQEWLTRFLSPEISPDLGPRICYAIRINPTTTSPPPQGKVIGTLGLHTEPHPTTPSNNPKDIFELGYMFHPSVWGRGYASEAVSAVVDRWFCDPGAEDIRQLKELREKEREGVEVEKGLFGIVNQGNEASVGVLRKVGFTGPVEEMVEGDGRRSFVYWREF